MEVRDPVHGSIHILDEEIPIIQHSFFQRLRNIKQLGFSDLIFPGATHTRFLHSIGVMYVGNKAFDGLFKGRLGNKEVLKLKETFKLACLLHDIGHAPLSHSTETVMPQLSELKIPEQFLKGKDKNRDRQATHEDYTIKSIADSSFAESFKLVEEEFGVERVRIADLIVGQTTAPEYYTIEGIDYFPILHQLVSSELDCDRMDYLLRDSYFCGVSYGGYDLDWLLDNLEPCITENRAFLGINERAVVTFDDFLLSRYHMFMMVYFHYRSVALEQLLYKYFATSPEEYKIPADIEAYVEHDDYLLMKVLKLSDNKYAKSLVQNKIPQKIFESFNETQLKTLDQVQNYLEQENIEFIRCSSLGRLSKYYTEDSPSDKFTMKVSRELFESGKKKYFDINDSTDLFQKFSNSHAVNRLHCEFEQLPEAKQKAILAIIHST
ncbi:MAG: hydrolase [Halobacteriovorax sp.]|nr:hydrolase [Halobacteriovorax sp.]|tara:strand:+ start:816 stop:2123 length:1308 start_codon:yes stop_codon:yes gene_type:complete